MTQTPDIPPVIESHESEYRDSGIVSTVAIAGHPLHPLLVTFPIGLLSAVFATDVGFLLTGDEFWARASIWLIGAGFISGIVAAVTGMSDFLRINRVRKRRAGWVHMIGNIALLSLTLVNWLIRLGGNYVNVIVPIGLLISTLVAGALAITGWYGAELIYRHKVAVIGYNSRNE